MMSLTNLPFELVDSSRALDSLSETVATHGRPGPVVVLTDAPTKFLANDDLLDLVLASLPAAGVTMLGGGRGGGRGKSVV